MPGCCRSAVCEEMFGAKEARRTLRRYRKKGINKLERRMVASVPGEALTGARVLEIGGGIGTIQAELIRAGATGGEIVEIVSAYEPYARELAQAAGIESRSSFRLADVLDQPESVTPADIVVLNRVVCCTSDGVRLTGVAAHLANRMLLMVYPRDRLAVRIFLRLGNTALRVMGRSFRAFLHSREALYAAARAEGLVVAETGQSFVWEYAALRRVP